MNSIGFDFIAEADARVLILGTLPGTLSLEKGEYYAQPRNHFWRIMWEIYGNPATNSYPNRTAQLRKAGIALWDVCASASRVGSLDVNIKDFVANDFAGFFSKHPQIELICFNGAKAEKLYLRHVLPGLTSPASSIHQCRLPSTSPAHAVPLTQKLEKWREALTT